jgi:tRNA G18 (ribose-2'-O)-methylase SpoU
VSSDPGVSDPDVGADAQLAVGVGQEGPGLSDPAHAACDYVYSIAQFGSTRSINAGVASGIAMHAWIRAHALPTVTG